MRGLRALFVTDVHVLPRTTRAELDALVDRIAAAGPRLLLLGGDYSDDAEGCVRFFEALGRVRFPLGCFGVIGNNDAEAWEGNLKALRSVMSPGRLPAAGQPIRRSPLGGGTLCVGGIDEYRYGHPRPTAVARRRPGKPLSHTAVPLSRAAGASARPDALRPHPRRAVQPAGPDPLCHRLRALQPPLVAPPGGLRACMTSAA